MIDMFDGYIDRIKLKLELLAKAKTIIDINIKERSYLEIIAMVELMIHNNNKDIDKFDEISILDECAKYYIQKKDQY